MTTQYLRTSAALFGLAALLLNGLAAAQPTADAPQPGATPIEPSAQPVPSAPEPKPAPVAAIPAPVPASPAAPPGPAPAPQLAPARDDGPPTLFHSGIPVGGYGHLDVAYTRLAGKDAALLCGGGALLVDHRFSLGLAGCGNASRISGQPYGDVTHESGDRLEFGYGGLVVGYQFFPKQIYNLTLTAMVGGGASAVTNHRNSDYNDNWDNSDHVKTRDAVFVAEPRLTGYVNLTRWARAGAFAGYRFVSGSNMKNLSNSDLAGPVIGGTLQFGWF